MGVGVGVGVIIAPGQKANGDNMGLSGLSSIK